MNVYKFLDILYACGVIDFHQYMRVQEEMVKSDSKELGKLAKRVQEDKEIDDDG